MNLSQFRVSDSVAVIHNIPTQYTAGMDGVRRIEVVDGCVVIHRDSEASSIFISSAGIGFCRPPGRPPGSAKKGAE